LEISILIIMGNPNKRTPLASPQRKCQSNITTFTGTKKKNTQPSPSRTTASISSKPAPLYSEKSSKDNSFSSVDGLAAYEKNKVNDLDQNRYRALDSEGEEEIIDDNDSQATPKAKNSSEDQVEDVEMTYNDT
jgi:hypothetical protein